MRREALFVCAVAIPTNAGQWTTSEEEDEGVGPSPTCGAVSASGSRAHPALSRTRPACSPRLRPSSTCPRMLTTIRGRTSSGSTLNACLRSSACSSAPTIPRCGGMWLTVPKPLLLHCASVMASHRPPFPFPLHSTSSHCILTQATRSACQGAAASAGILTSLCNFAFNSSYPSKSAFYKALAEMMRGNEENQGAFQAFITTQGVDAVIASLRLAFDSSQVAAVGRGGGGRERERERERERSLFFPFLYLGRPSRVQCSVSVHRPPSPLPSPLSVGRASTRAAPHSTACSASCTIIQTAKCRWRRRCSPRARPKGRRPASSCARHCARPTPP